MRNRGSGNKVDANQMEIIVELRSRGASVLIMSELGNGAPDLLCGYMGSNYAFEVKNPLLIPSKRKLSDDEVEWHKNWRGQVHVIETADEAWGIIENLGIRPEYKPLIDAIAAAEFE